MTEPAEHPSEHPGERFAETEELPAEQKIDVLQECIFLLSEIQRMGTAESIQEAQELVSEAGGAKWPVGSYYRTFGALALIFARPSKHSQKPKGLFWWLRNR